MEEQLSVMRSGLQEQSKAAQSLHSELLAQLQAIQTQVAQVRTLTPLFGPFKMPLVLAKFMFRLHFQAVLCAWNGHYVLFP